jgi:hypothetical protein
MYAMASFNYSPSTIVTIQKSHIKMTHTCVVGSPELPGTNDAHLERRLGKLNMVAMTFAILKYISLSILFNK